MSVLITSAIIESVSRPNLGTGAKGDGGKGRPVLRGRERECERETDETTRDTENRTTRLLTKAHVQVNKK